MLNTLTAHKVWDSLMTLAASCQRLYVRHPRLVNIITVVVIFGLFWLRCFGLLDPDFGWHLMAGNYIRSHWIPSHDIYSYTASSYRWIDHEWGNDVLVSWLYQVGGYGLLSVVFAGLWTAGICLFRTRLRLGVLILALLAIMPYVGVRPAVWTVVCLALLLELLERGSTRAKLALPLLFLIWANLHGGFSIGLAVVAYYVLKDTFQLTIKHGLRHPQFSWHPTAGLPLLSVLGMCILVTFINPYGPRLYVEIYHTLFDPAIHNQIAEWSSFNVQQAGIGFIMFWAIGFWLFDKRKPGSWFGLPTLLIIASLSASRNLPLFVVAALRDSDRYGSSFHMPKQMDRPRQMVMAALVATAVIIATVWLYQAYLPWHGRNSGYPLQAVAYLQTHPCDGNLFNSYNYGGYLIWKLPGKPVYIDGRMPTWHEPSGDTYIDTYDDVFTTPAVQKAQFATYNIRCALLQGTPKAKLVISLRNQGWRLVLSKDDSLLLLAPFKTSIVNTTK